MRSRISGICLAMAVCFMLVCLPASAVQRYEVIDLGSLGGGVSTAFGMNNKGQIVGYSTTESGEQHAFVWDRTHGMQDLGTFGYAEGSASDINDAGRIVGTGSTDYVSHAAILDSIDGDYWRPDPLPGDLMTGTFTVNESGQMAGLSGEEMWTHHAVVWDSDGHVIHDFGPGAVGEVGNNGDVVGFLYEPYPGLGFDLEQAFYWSEATGLRRLGWGRAHSVNDSGIVVGGPSNFGGTAFTWDSNNGTRSVQAFGSNSELLAINNLGQAAGSYDIDQYTTHAIRWDSPDSVVDLGTLPGYSSSLAACINDAGMMAGYSWRGDAKWRATAWIPVVPEPSGILILTTALAGTAFKTLRRRSGRVSAPVERRK